MGFHDFNQYRKLLDKDFLDAHGEKAPAAFEDFLHHALLFFTSIALRDFESDPVGKPVPPYLASIRSFFSKIIENENPWTRSPQFLSTRCLLHLRYNQYNGKTEFPGPSLDLGCGEGRTIHLALENPSFDVGSDLIHSDLVEARKFGMHKYLVAADARKIPLKDSYFQTVMCNYTLCHIGDKRSVLKEVARVMKPGGWFYFDDVALRQYEFKDRPFNNLVASLGSTKLSEDHKRFYHSCYDSSNKWDVPVPPKEMCAMLEDLGFTNIEYEYCISKETMQIGYFFLDLVPFLQRELYYESKQYREFVYERLARCVNMDRALCKERNEGNFVYYKAQRK